MTGLSRRVKQFHYFIVRIVPRRNSSQPRLPGAADAACAPAKRWDSILFPVRFYPFVL